MHPGGGTRGGWRRREGGGEVKEEVKEQEVGKGGLDAIFSREGWGWTMEMDDGSVEIERSQHASTTQRGQRQGKNRTGGRDGLQVNLDHPKMFHSWEAKRYM